MASQQWARVDRGATRVEIGLALAIVIVVGAVAFAWAGNGVFGWATTAPEALEPVGGQAVSAAAPVSVNVAAAATISQPDEDTCPRLLGRQPRGFDCTLPLYVDAMDKPRPAGKVKYFCADSTRYNLVGGQRPALHKKCVLTTAARAGT